MKIVLGVEKQCQNVMTFSEYWQTHSNVYKQTGNKHFKTLYQSVNHIYRNNPSDQFFKMKTTQRNVQEKYFAS